MFWSRKRTAQTVTYQSSVRFESVAGCSIENLINRIKTVLTERSVSTSLLAAYQVVPERYLRYLRLAIARSRYNRSLATDADGYIRYLSFHLNILDTVSEKQALEFRKREALYLAVVLKEIHARAQGDAKLWDIVADIWIEILNCEPVSHDELSKMWEPDEVVIFSPVYESMTSTSGFCESFLIPHELKYNQKIFRRLDRSLPDDINEDIRTSMMGVSDCLGLLDSRDSNAVLPTLPELEPIVLKS